MPKLHHNNSIDEYINKAEKITKLDPKDKKKYKKFSFEMNEYEYTILQRISDENNRSMVGQLKWFIHDYNKKQIKNE